MPGWAHRSERSRRDAGCQDPEEGIQCVLLGRAVPRTWASEASLVLEELLPVPVLCPAAVVLPEGDTVTPFRRCTFSAETELDALVCFSRKVSM
jgi:hypothetical protein